MVLGKIQKLVDPDGDAVFPLTTAEAVFVNKDKNLAQRLKEIAVSGTYQIDLDRFGVVKGWPTKPYTNADYIKANNNITGINNAMIYAQQEGYQGVILPKGDYSLCYPNTITMVSNMILNLNGSRLKVMYDSDNRSPFDNGGVNIFDLAGVAVTFKAVENAHLVNGEIIGDIYERSFSNIDERWNESSYGVSFGYGSRFCSVGHCTIRGFMGDNVNYLSYGAAGGNPSSYTLNDIDASGNLIASTNTIVTDLIDVIPGYTCWASTGLGYSRQLNINDKEYDVHYYKADGSYLGALKKKMHTSLISIPPLAVKMRIRFNNETDPSKDTMMQINFGGFAQYCTTEYCDLRDGHRGGITGGGNYCEIRYNIIRENGPVGGQEFLTGGAPLFPDSTRYAINQEDSYGENTVIKGNVIIGGFHGILIRGYSGFIENNLIQNCGGSGIVTYDLKFTKITGNYFRRANVSTFGTGAYNLANVNVSNNYFENSSVGFYNPYYDAICDGNYFIDALGDIGTAQFTNNTVRSKTADVAITLNSKAQGNYFFVEKSDYDSGIRRVSYFTTKDYLCKNNEFENIELRHNQSTATKPILSDGCTFKNVTLGTQTNTNKWDFKNCFFRDCTIKPQNINGNEFESVYRLDNCILESTISTQFFYPSSNKNNIKTIIIVAENSKFFIRNSNFVSLVDNFYGTRALDITFRNNYIEYTGSTTLPISYSANDGEIMSFAFATNNRLKNVVFKTPTQPTYYKFYDPDVMGTTEPTYGYFPAGKTFAQAVPVAAGSVGWLCITAGIANNASWLASTTIAAGYQINYNNVVYEAQNAGTTAKVQPTFPTGAYATVDDKASISNWAASTAYAVGDIVLPTASNSFFYECTTAGSSGATQPTWGTTAGGTTSETGQTLVWTARAIITWKQLGAKAVFKSYGVISS